MTIGVGVELGDGVMRAAVVERQGSSARLVGLAETPWASTAQDETAAALKQLRKLLAINRAVVLGLPSSSAITATIVPLVVNRARADLAVQFELQQQLPYDAAQAVWHYSWWSSTNGGAQARAGAWSPAVVAAIKRSLLEERLEACRRAGVAVRAVAVNPVAAANVWARQSSGASASTAVLLRVEASTAEWIIAGPTGVHSVPVLLPPEAQPLEHATEPLIDALRASWLGVTEFLESHTPPATASTPRATIQTVQLFGAYAALPGFAQALSTALSCAVTPFNLSQTMTLGAGTPAQPQAFVVACGLALQAADAARVPLNLLVDIQRRRRARAIKQTAWSTTAISGLLAAALAAHGLWALLERRQQALAALVTQEQVYQSLRPEIRAIMATQAQLERRLAQLDDLASRRLVLVQALQRVTESLPADVWTAKIELTKDDAGLSGLVEGFAPSFQGVTRFMDALKSSVGWTSVKPLSTTVKTDDKTGKEVVAFTVQSQHTFPVMAAAEPAKSEPSSRKPARSAARAPTSRDEASE